MLLLEIEEHVKPLSKADKEQLIRDVWRMLQEEAGPGASRGAEDSFQSAEPVDIPPPVDTTETARELEELLKASAYKAGTDVLTGTKYEGGWNFEEAAKTAENLQAYIDTQTGLKTLDESKLIFVEGCDL